MKRTILNRLPIFFYPLIATIIYIGIFVVLHESIDNGMFALAIFPVAIASWFLGIRVGIIWFIIFLGINVSFIFFFESSENHKELLISSLSGSLFVLMVGIGAGWIRTLNQKIKIELTKREKYQAALQKSEEKFRAQFENLSEGIAIDKIIYDDDKPVDWIITDVNPAYERIMRLTREDVIGKHATELYGSYETIEPFLKSYDHVLRTGKPISNQAHYLIRDRKIVISASSLGDDQIVVIFSDVTEQEKTVESEKKQREFSAIMAKIISALNETMKLDEVLNIILENLEKFVSFDAADITLIQDDQLRIARHIGYHKLGLFDFAENFNVNVNDIATCKWMIEYQSPMVVADTSKSDIWTTFPEVNWIKSYLGLPIIARGKVVGILNFLSAEKGFYENFPYEDLLPFSEQAAFAIENTRTFEETQNRSQRLAVINEIAFQMNQPTELDTLQQMAVDYLAEALNIHQVGLAMMNPDKKTMTIVADHLAPGNQSVKGSTITLEENPSMEYILSNKSSFHSQDAQNDPMLKAVNHFMTAQHINSILLIPLIAGGEVIGTIGCDIINENRIFTPEEISLAEIITNLVAGRIELEKLIMNEKKRATELSMLYETSLAITKPYELSKLHNQIVERATWLLDATAGMLYLKTDKDDVFECKVSYNNQYDPVGTTLKIDQGAVGIVARTLEPFIINDYGNWHDKPDIFSKLTEKFALLSVPVIHQSRIMGVIQILRDPGKPSFTQEEANLLSLFSNQVAITLENSRLLNEVQELAIHDPLTGLFNRRGFAEIAEREIEIFNRFGHPLSLLFIDLDHFKEVNDSHGHAIGDQILIGIANRCKNILRNVDVICRYGGEEIVILLLESDLEVAVEIGKRINNVVKLYPFHTEVGPITQTVSIGVAEYQNYMKNVDSIILNADMALYKAKSNGRDCVVPFLEEDFPSKRNDK